MTITKTFMNRVVLIEIRLLITVYLLMYGIDTKHIVLFPCAVACKKPLVAGVDQIIINGHLDPRNASSDAWPLANVVFTMKPTGSAIFDVLCRINFDNCSVAQEIRCYCLSSTDTGYDFIMKDTAVPSWSKAELRAEWASTTFDLYTSNIVTLPVFKDDEEKRDRHLYMYLNITGAALGCTAILSPFFVYIIYLRFVYPAPMKPISCTNLPNVIEDKETNRDCPRQGKVSLFPMGNASRTNAFDNFKALKMLHSTKQYKYKESVLFQKQNYKAFQKKKMK